MGRDGKGEGGEQKEKGKAKGRGGRKEERGRGSLKGDLPLPTKGG